MKFYNIKKKKFMHLNFACLAIFYYACTQFVSAHAYQTEKFKFTLVYKQFPIEKMRIRTKLNRGSLKDVFKNE